MNPNNFINVSEGGEAVAVINALAEKVGIVIDWANANAVPYVMELMGKYIQYEIANSAVNIVLAVLAILACVWAIKKGMHIIKHDPYNDIFGIILVAIGGVAAFFIAPSIIVGIRTIVKCLLFPELQIIEFLSTFAK